MQLPTQVNDVIAYFMTEYATDSSPSLLEETVQNLLAQTLRHEYAQDLTQRFFTQIQRTLVEEFNQRFGKRHTLRFRLLDSDGTKIAGIGDLGHNEKLAFQDAINGLSHAQFEGLAALVLEIAGCAYFRRTPESHDQGVDAFGYMDYFVRKEGAWNGASPRITFLAQAKHYSECKVGTKEIREFVGSYDLALHKVYSTVDQRYRDLEILPFAPVALVFVTSEEIPATVKRLASRSGVVVLSSDDLFDILLPSLPQKPTSISKKWLIDTWVSKTEAIPVAK